MNTVHQRDQKRFNHLTKNMDIPEFRREINPPNMRWFLRNAAIRNQDNPNLFDALEIARKYSE